jgi:two-component system nitrate/nitrite response regulator NarL
MSDRSVSVGDAGRSPKGTITVLLVTDLRLYGESLESGLPRFGVEVVGAVGEASIARDVVRERAPDVVLLDMSMPGAPELALTLRAFGGSIGIVALAVTATPAVVLACARAGVVGYALRGTMIEEIAGIIRSAATGELRCPSVIAQILCEHATGFGAERESPSNTLTRREREIIPLLDQGLDNRPLPEPWASKSAR